jgi:hypothetical protein
VVDEQQHFIAGRKNDRVPCIARHHFACGIFLIAAENFACVAGSTLGA